MDPKDFTFFRKKLGKTQRQMAELLGASLKAVHSYEQGWRNIPVHAERQMLFLISKSKEGRSKLNSCWKVKNCPPEQRNKCPAWEFRAGKLCWFINGTICEGTVQQNWKEKMQLCRHCEVLRPLLPQAAKQKG
ncbi:helix-turn-helix domain-containing protein [Thermodesulfobacteriota bacterium]